MEKINAELHLKCKLLDEANDQIVCLKSKLHGLRTIITHLRLVETKYKKLKSKLEKSSSNHSLDNNIYIIEEPSKKSKLVKTRNAYLKTSRTKTDSSLYEETFSSSKRSKKDGDSKKKQKTNKYRDKSKLKLTSDNTIQITEQYYPSTTQSKYTNVSSKSKLDFHEINSKQEEIGAEILILFRKIKMDY